jgi:hypothetical protein
MRNGHIASKELVLNGVLGRGRFAARSGSEYSMRDPQISDLA